MARFATFALCAVASLQGVMAQDESTAVAISVGDLQTTITLPAFPEPTAVSTETVIATSLVYEGVVTTTTIIPFPPVNVTSVTQTTLVTVPANTSIVSNVNTAAQASYISSLLSDLRNATTTVTATTTFATGTGGLPSNTTTGSGPEFTGAATMVKSTGLSVLGLVVFGVASLIVV